MTSLGDLGLSEYEASVYRALLRTGPTTASTLSDASDVPMGRIYDVLSDLEGAGMVRSQNASRPKKYAPVEPSTALERRLEDKRRELAAEREQYEAAVEELADQLDPADPGGEFWTVAVGPEDTVDLLTERLDAATDRIVMVVSEPSAGFDIGQVGERIGGRFESALDRGVSVSVLASPDLLSAVPEEVQRRYRETVGDHPDFELRVTPDVSGAFHVIDGAEVCVEVPHPLAPDEAFALIDLTDPAFVADVMEAFRPRWKAAEPATV